MVDKKTVYVIMLVVKKNRRIYRRARLNYFWICATGWIRSGWQDRKDKAKLEREKARKHYELWHKELLALNLTKTTP